MYLLFSTLSLSLSLSLFFSRSLSLSLPDLPRIEVGGIPVPYVETAENLGVTINSKFTWKPQVEAVAKTVNRALYSLNFFRHFTTLDLQLHSEDTVNLKSQM